MVADKIRRFMIHAKVRSTTRRRCITTKPFASGGRLTISGARWVLSCAHCTKRLAWPPSAQTFSTKGKRARERISKPVAAGATLVGASCKPD